MKKWLSNKRGDARLLSLILLVILITAAVYFYLAKPGLKEAPNQFKKMIAGHPWEATEILASSRI